MLLERGIAFKDKNYISASKYVCDMCRKPLTKKQRILFAASNVGEDALKKRHDLCENCMKIIEKNITIWYDKIVNKK